MLEGSHFISHPAGLEFAADGTSRRGSLRWRLTWMLS